ncbi:hypothetical protein J2X65_003540 [Ancylobacter sp. 3268]|uniref:hypothetical protein n=1 Tax=Ancylobacter sp. 3268 TaxID=2817752 RepID=UPI002861E82A|nr:hypothetical protein [Ancylobacter sp. 3268]MDR6954172.1 hypothetical protein [Ancylobacter sp. 3268]
MATGQGILDRLKRVKAGASAPMKRGVLPLVAFYGREPESEAMRRKMYDAIERVMAMDDARLPADTPVRQHHMLLDWGDAVGILNVDASPIELLVYRGELETPLDDEGMAGVRFYSAVRFRDLHSSAGGRGYKSFSLERVDGGGASSDLSGYQLDCIKHIERIRAAMPKPWLYPMFEAAVVRDQWFDLRAEHDNGDGRRDRTISALCFGLDVVAVELGNLNRAGFKRRWPDGAPVMPPSVRRWQRSTAAPAR